MPRSRWFSLAALLTLAAFVLTAKVNPGKDEGLTAIKVDYPIEDSIFPPDFSAPTFLWRDESENVVGWQVDVSFADGSQIHSMTAGEPMQVYDIAAFLDPKTAFRVDQSSTIARSKSRPLVLGGNPVLPPLHLAPAIRFGSLQIRTELSV